MKRRALLAGLAAAGLVATLSGCTLANAITPPIETQLYPTTADARASSATIAVPSWVPDDAQMIRIKENSETGEAIMQFGVDQRSGKREQGAAEYPDADDPEGRTDVPSHFCRCNEDA